MRELNLYPRNVRSYFISLENNVTQLHELVAEHRQSHPDHARLDALAFNHVPFFEHILREIFMEDFTGCAELSNDKLVVYLVAYGVPQAKAFEIASTLFADVICTISTNIPEITNKKLEEYQFQMLNDFDLFITVL